MNTLLCVYNSRGGLLIKPKKIEFWQGQSNRLHDRIVFFRPENEEILNEKFTHLAENGWLYKRLSP